MTNKNEKFSQLRVAAEAGLVHMRKNDINSRSAEELLHELEVHQIELEMQNDALRLSQLTLEESRDRYVDFYDFAPVGYLTLTRHALISEINLTGAALLGRERKMLLNRRFSGFVARDDRDLWHRHFMEVIQRDSKLSCELDVMRDDGSRMHILLDSLRLQKTGHEQVVRIALSDITELKLAEAALRQSESYLRKLEQREIVQTSLDGFGAFNVHDARIVEVSDVFCGMVGYSREALLSMSVVDLEANKSAEKVASYVKKIMAIGYARFETRLRHRQGNLLDFEISASHSELDGDIIFVFARDINERKSAEFELRESESRFRTLFESSTDCILILDSRGRIVDINKTGYGRLGYDEQEMLGRHIAEFNSPESAAQIAQRLDKVAKEGTGIFESVHLCKDSTLMPVEVNSKVIYFHGMLHHVSVVRDITERKLAEQKISELQYRNELILNTAGDGICGINEQGRINFINPAAEKMLGYNTMELFGQFLDGVVRPGNIDAYTCPVADCKILSSIGNNITVCRKGEELYRRKDGSSFPVSYTRAPIVKNGKCAGSVLTFRDNTERKRTEQQLRELSAHLQSVREEEKTRFAREIHDDLGGTLSALKIEAQLLDNGLSDEQKKSPLFARVESMIALLDDAMKATRSIITELRPTVLDDLGLMAALAWQADEFRKRTDIECFFACVAREERDCKNCKDCKFTLDKTLSINLFRITQEALTNVANHSGASRVEIEFRPCEKWVELSIADNGCGIPEEIVIPSTSYGIRGMRERVAQMGGEIKLGNVPAGGFRVSVNLPVRVISENHNPAGC